MKGYLPGFTLIEILVVIFIISIMTSITVANLPGFASGGEFDTESRKLKVLLEMARDEALLQANEFGFKPGENEYRFYIYDDINETWSELDQRPFQPRQLDGDFVLSLSVDGNEFNLGESREEAPPVMLLSSGETTPFRLTISFRPDGLSRTLIADGFSEMEWANNASTK